MYRSEIKDLQDTVKRWNRFKDRCEKRQDQICRHELTGGMLCNMAVCPGGDEDPRTGTIFNKCDLIQIHVG